MKMIVNHESLRWIVHLHYTYLSVDCIFLLGVNFTSLDVTFISIVHKIYVRSSAYFSFKCEAVCPMPRWPSQAIVYTIIKEYIPKDQFCIRCPDGDSVDYTENHNGKITIHLCGRRDVMSKPLLRQNQNLWFVSALKPIVLEQLDRLW
jgi:hypothetical protein